MNACAPRLIVSMAVAALLANEPGAAVATHAADSGEQGEIHIVGTVHAPTQLRSVHMSPGHVRAALEALDPDVVCIECNPVWFADDRYYLTNYEAFGVAVPWARERGRPVYGVDWLGRSDGSESAWYSERFVGGIEEGERLLTIEEPDPVEFLYGFDRWVEAPEVDIDADYAFDVLNGDAWLYRAPDTGEPRDWGALDFTVEFGSLSSFTQERDRHIAKFVDDVAAKHPGARIAVVFGAGHRDRLGWFLRQRGLKVESIGEVFRRFPPDDVERFESLLTPRDAAAILSLAWDGTTEAYGVSSARCARLRALLDASTEPEVRVWKEYLAARETMLRGDDAGAEEQFRELVRSGRGRSLGFPYRGNEWRLYLTVEQSARLELGRIADLSARRDEAIEHYQALLASIEIPVDRDGYQNNARFRHLARAYAATRALIRTPYLPVAALASRDDLSAADLVNAAWRANGVGQWDLARQFAERALVAGASGGQAVDAHYARVRALVLLGRGAEAANTFEELTRLREATPKGHRVGNDAYYSLQTSVESLARLGR